MLGCLLPRPIYSINYTNCPSVNMNADIKTQRSTLPRFSTSTFLFSGDSCRRQPRVSSLLFELSEKHNADGSVAVYYLVLMDRRFNSFFAGGEQEEVPSTPENSIGSPFPGEKKSRSAASPKRRKRAVQKRVVSVPIADMEGSRMKGEGAPPSDSWAWRKYGQKPIKGSPYPRGYYRCSSSKGCPARKQVERSQVDPTMIVVTYACEHNHQAGPTPRTAAAHAPKPPLVFSAPPETEPDGKFADLPDDAPLSDDFGWFSNVASSSSPSTEAVFHSPIFTGNHVDDADVAEMIFPMREEDESLFADLGELPEFSMVFRHGVLEQEENLRAAPWCRSTS